AGMRYANKAGSTPYDTLTGIAAPASAEETYLIVKKLGVWRARVEFARYIPMGGGNYKRSDRVPPGTFGVCEVLHGPWSVAAAEFWTCDHVHLWLRCLNRDTASAATIYATLRRAKPPECAAQRPAR